MKALLSKHFFKPLCSVDARPSELALIPTSSRRGALLI